MIFEDFTMLLLCYLSLFVAACFKVLFLLVVRISDWLAHGPRPRE